MFSAYPTEFHVGMAGRGETPVATGDRDNEMQPGRLEFVYNIHINECLKSLMLWFKLPVGNG